MNLYLACFDIEEDKARRKIGNILLEYGERVQYSVFEISVKNHTTLDKIERRCSSLLEPGDRLYFYYLPKIARDKSHDVWGNRLAQYPQAIIL